MNNEEYQPQRPTIYCQAVNHYNNFTGFVKSENMSDLKQIAKRNKCKLFGTVFKTC